MTPRTLHLVPWWVGITRSGRKPAQIRHSSLLAALDTQLNDSVDVDLWLGANAKVERFYFNLVRKGLLLTAPGYCGLGDGVAVYEIMVSEGVADDMSPARVIGWLYGAVMNALDEIGSKLGAGPPVLRAGTHGMEDHSHTGRIATVVDAAESQRRCLALVSPADKGRDSMQSLLKSIGRELETAVAGWQAWLLTSTRPADSIEPIGHWIDFSSINKPTWLDEMAGYCQLVLVESGTRHLSNVARRKSLLAASSAVEHAGPLQLKATGLDNGVAWSAFGWGKRQDSQSLHHG